MKKILFVLPVLICMSCASYKVYKANPSAVNEEGVRFYRSEPYLMVSKEETTGKLTFSIIYLPNTKQEYVIKKKGFLGHAELNIKLENGWNMTEYGSISDSKIPEIISSIAEFIPTIRKTPEDPNAKSMLPDYFEPGLYRLEFDANTGFIKGIVKVK